MDYVLFVYALGLAFLAAVLLGLSTTVSSPVPWRWLGLSAATLAVSSTAELLGLSLLGRTVIDVVQTMFFAAGCLLLLEFARRCWIAAGGRRVGPWVVIVLAALSALGLLAGPRGSKPRRATSWEWWAVCRRRPRSGGSLAAATGTGARSRSGRL